MKKLLALVLVLAMASVASATIEVLVLHNGQAYDGTDVQPSDWLEVVILATDEVQTLPLFAGSSINSTLGDQVTASWPDVANPSMGGWTITPVEDGFTSSGGFNWIPPVTNIDGIIFSVKWHVPDGTPASTEFCVDWNINYGGTVYTGNELIHVVPEPMTIALLGLGGLFLRRRRS